MIFWNVNFRHIYHIACTVYVSFISLLSLLLLSKVENEPPDSYSNSQASLVSQVHESLDKKASKCYEDAHFVNL